MPTLRNRDHLGHTRPTIIPRGRPHHTRQQGRTQHPRQRPNHLQNMQQKQRQQNTTKHQTPTTNHKNTRLLVKNRQPPTGTPPAHPCKTSYGLVKYLPFVVLSFCRLLVWWCVVVQPELPDSREWCEETRRWWRVWGEDSRAQYVSDEEWLFLLDAAVIHDVVWREGRADLVASLRAHVKAFMGMLDRYSVDVVSGGRGGGSAVAMIDRYRKRKGA